MVLQIFLHGKGFKIISTEGRIEISSPKEIVLTAGGSQIKINSKGVFVSTSGGNLRCKAGQHCFEGGERVASVQHSLPQAETEYSHQIDYQWDVATEDEKEIFVVGKQDGRLINTNKKYTRCKSECQFIKILYVRKKLNSLR